MPSEEPNRKSWLKQRDALLAKAKAIQGRLKTNTESIAKAAQVVEELEKQRLVLSGRIQESDDRLKELDEEIEKSIDRARIAEEEAEKILKELGL